MVRLVTKKRTPSTSMSGAMAVRKADEYAEAVTAMREIVRASADRIKV